MKKYIDPEIKIIELKNEDIVISSSNSFGNDDPYGVLAYFEM